MEDDEAIRLALRKALTLSGHEVQDAGNGAEGAKLYRQNPPPDLIITDILMPDQDGV